MLVIGLFSIPSLVSYVIFYDTVIPHSVIQYPVYFNYTTGLNFPTAEVRLDHFSIDPRLPGTSLLQIKMPHSPRNSAMGNFMVSVDFQDRNQRSLKQVKRTVLLPHRSPIHEYLKLIVCSPLYFMGILEETDIVNVRLFESETFAKSFNSITTLSVRFSVKNTPAQAIVKIYSKDIEFYEATLAFASKLHGMRWFMYTHKVSAFLVFTSLFWFTGITSTIITYLIVSSTSETKATRR
ncbi:Siepin [Schizosaccharomyces pombe]